jgi:Protein of unknown function (DUF3605)
MSSAADESAAADVIPETDCQNDDDDDDDEVELPPLEHGYREVPMEWPELREIVGSGQLSRLTRHKSQQRKYEIFKRSLRRKWRSLCDYVYVSA